MLTLQPKLQELLGQTLVVDNRQGSAGNIGSALGAQASPDGYTLLFTADLPITMAAEAE